MGPARTLTVPVAGAREALLPTTWGQRSIMQWHGRVDEEHYTSNSTSSETYELPGGCDLAAVTAAIGYVLARHDALRSVFRTEDGGLRQVIQPAGQAEVMVFEAADDDVEAAAGAARDGLCADPWNGTQWPVRWAVVTDGPPVLLVTRHNKLVLDEPSMGIVIEEVMQACAGNVSEKPPSWQQADEAAFEHSPEGAATGAWSAEHWREILYASPSSSFDFPPQPHSELRYALESFASVPMGRAVQMMRKRWRVTGATLVLSAAAIAVTRYNGHPDVVMQMISANRGDRNRRQMVGALTSQGLVRLEVGQRPFSELVRDAFQASRDGHKSGYHDPGTVAEVRAGAELLHGAHLDLGVYFNDVQTGQDAQDAEPEMSEEELRKLAESSGLAGGAVPPPPAAWDGDHEAWPVSPARKDIRFLLMCQHGPVMPASLFCDTKYIPVATAQQMLTGIERILIAAACEDLDTAELGRLSGVDPVSRGPSWVRGRYGWTDLAAVRQLWRQVTGTNDSAVFAEVPADGGEPRLVGYLAAPAPRSLAALHKAFVAALGRRNDARTPDWYRLVRSAPAEAGVPEAWRRAGVLTEGDGRS